MRAKSNTFDRDAVEAARLAKALGHPVRIRILQVLGERNTCICGELVALLPLAQSTVSQHLRVLKGAGLINGEIEGPKTCYCLDRTAIKRAIETLRGAVTKGRRGP